jgi:predicted RNase H-like HicB family nuclease
LGHKRIETTLTYTHLVSFADEEYVSAVAKDIKKALELIEAGFEYITEMDGAKIFRKRK